MLDNLRIRKCLYLVLTILVSMAGLISLANLGFDIPVVRQLVGFVFLTFVPGILFLRFLRIHNLSTLENLTYSVGLSVAFVMLSGLLANFVSPFFGVDKPISALPIVVTMTILTLILGTLAFWQDRGFSPPTKRPQNQGFSPSFLFLILLMLLAVSGSFLVNYQNNNILLLVVIALIALTIGLAAFGRFIPKTVYPLAVILITLSLIYSTTLSSPGLSAYDIQVEYYYQAFVSQSGYWDLARAGNVNTALSIVLVTPIYSSVLDMNAVWVFKVVYPLFSSLVPLALFGVYSRQIGDKRALVSVFFLISVIIFAGLENRQMVAELFFTLLLLLVVDSRLERIQKSALAIIFVMGIPLSHYGFALVTLAFFVLGWLLLNSLGNELMMNWLRKRTTRFFKSAVNARVPPGHVRFPSASVLSGNLVTLYVVCTLAWAMYIASGTVLTSMAHILGQIVQNLQEFLNPLARESLVRTAIGLDFAEVSSLGKAFRIFQYITEILIIVGFVRLLFKPRDYRFRAEHVAMIIIAFLVLFTSIVVPYFSGYLEVERFYHIALLLIAPLCIIGGETILQGLSKLFRTISQLTNRVPLVKSMVTHGDISHVYLGLLTLVVVVPYFLFTSGFFFEIAKSEQYDKADTPASPALSRYRLDMKTTNYRQVMANTWLAESIDKSSLVYADIYAALPISGLLPGRTKAFPIDMWTMPEDTYIYLKTWNMEKKEAIFMMRSGEQIWFEHIKFEALPKLSRLINTKNLVYNNGGVEIMAP